LWIFNVEVRGERLISERRDQRKMAMGIGDWGMEQRDGE
jgi:hypothetical protein